MAFDKDKREIKTIDEDKNIWRITLTKMETKTNRFQLSFHFNEKEFGLMKLQSNSSAENIWELLEKLKKGKVKKDVEKPREALERPKKRVLEVYPEIEAKKGAKK